MEEFPIEALDLFTYTEDKPITRFVEQINEPIDTSVYKKLKYKVLVDWLKRNDYLTVEYSEELKKDATLPTQKGQMTGIRAEKKVSTAGQVYIRVIYGKQAQEFLVENMDVILTEAERGTGDL